MCALLEHQLLHLGLLLRVHLGVLRLLHLLHLLHLLQLCIAHHLLLRTHLHAWLSHLRVHLAGLGGGLLLALELGHLLLLYW